MAAEPLVRLRKLVKRYGTKTALAGIDLELAKPEIVGVVGPDGAGKTTLLRTLAGLLEIEAEEATVLGADLRDDVRALKRRIGYVPQVFSLHPTLTIDENLAFTARLHQIPADELQRRSRELLERTGLAAFGDRRAGALSGGMKQKLAVSNALLPEPDLLLLDEPTAGVDVVARAEMWRLLEEACGRTLVVISTSYLDEAAASHRLIYLDDGRVVADGTPETLRRETRVDLYRIWCDDPRAVAEAARTLPWVRGARATGHAVRVEVEKASAPGADEVEAALSRLLAGTEHVVDHPAADMESVLLALAAA
jgi:ABC-2 type transport system ATP-binding protein